MADMLKRFLSIGEIADMLDEPIHRIRYVVERRAIPCEGRLGHARMFAPEAVRRIRHELAEIERRRAPALAPAV